MNVYTTDRIRNVVLLGHGGCGKTSLVEAMAYLAGMTSRMGKVEDGNTISDYDKEEMKRHFSINTSVVPIIWEDTKINILDTPGYFDFVGETEEAVSAADAAIIVVSGKAGIEVGTRKAWELCEQYKLPRMVFVTDMDIDEASYRQVVQDLQELYGKKIAPFHLPIRENGQFVGYVNVLQQRAKRWKENGEVEKADVPDYSKENLGICREALMEAVAETGKPVILVNMTGSAMDLRFADAHFSAVVQGWYPGARGGKAIAELLFGEYSPSGKLPVTFYNSADDLPAFTDYAMENRTYRYFAGDVLYPFGFGLTYGKTAVTAASAEKTEGGWRVTASLEHSGAAGGDVVEVYIRDNESKFAVRNYSLCGFKPVAFSGAEMKQAEIFVPDAALEIVDDRGERRVDSRSFTLFVGVSQPDAHSCALTGTRPAEIELHI